ncbi:MAG: hypothetical protein N2588_00540 [Rhodovarius sp.]|nr:hypothetical protein [Rhodovarius sp.]
MPRKLPRLPALVGLLCALPLAACDGPALVAAGAVHVASLTLTGRAVPDLAVSALTGRDCSLARLDRHLPYCGRAPDATPPPPPFCTRSLGTVDCWAEGPPPASPAYRGVADGPSPAGPGRPWHQLW